MANQDNKNASTGRLGRTPQKGWPPHQQTGLFVDAAQWRSSPSLRKKIKAVSWPRVSIAGSVLALLIGSGVWLTLQRDDIRAHPPRLPTEQEWQATQAAVAFEGELSPAIAAANQSVPSEVR